MGASDFLVDRSLSPIGFDFLKSLVDKFNEDHELSEISAYWNGDEIVKVKYKSRSGVDELSFDSFRKAERWMRRIYYSDID